MGNYNYVLNVCCVSIRGTTLKCKLSVPSSTDFKKKLYRLVIRIPPLQHIPNQTRPYFVHGFSTLSKKNLKFNKFVYIKVKAWIMHPLDFSWGSYFRGVLQSNIDPSTCNSNPDSRLSLWKKKKFNRGDCTLCNKKLLPPGMSLPDESVTGTLLLTQLTSAPQYIQVPLSKKFFHNAELVTWQLLKSVLLCCTSAAYLH